MRLDIVNNVVVSIQALFGKYRVSTKEDVPFTTSRPIGQSPGESCIQMCAIPSPLPNKVNEVGWIGRMVHFLSKIPTVSWKQHGFPNWLSRLVQCIGSPGMFCGELTFCRGGAMPVGRIVKALLRHKRDDGKTHWILPKGC